MNKHLNADGEVPVALIPSFRLADSGESPLMVDPIDGHFVYREELHELVLAKRAAERQESVSTLGYTTIRQEMPKYSTIRQINQQI